MRFVQTVKADSSLEGDVQHQNEEENTPKTSLHTAVDNAAESGPGSCGGIWTR